MDVFGQVPRASELGVITRYYSGDHPDELNSAAIPVDKTGLRLLTLTTLDGNLAEFTITYDDDSVRTETAERVIEKTASELGIDKSDFTSHIAENWPEATCDDFIVDISSIKMEKEEFKIYTVSVDLKRKDLDAIVKLRDKPRWNTSPTP
jgi:hypothetical protein